MELKLCKISENWYKKEKLNTSKTILPPLPEDIYNALEQHNERVLGIYSIPTMLYISRETTLLRWDLIISYLLSSIKISPKSINQTLSCVVPFVTDVFNNLENLTQWNIF